MIGNLYFIQEGLDGAIKIGWTRNSVEARLRNLQTGNRSELRLIGLITGVDHALERRWHKRFRHVNARAEWFNPDPMLLAAIRREAKEPAAKPRKIRGLSSDSLGIGPPVLLRFRAGYLRGDFSINEMAERTGSPSQAQTAFEQTPNQQPLTTEQTGGVGK